MFKESELILNNDGSIYHLKLKPEQLADTVLLVGDPGRVKFISDLFDTVEHRVENREFITHTGTYKSCRISVVATGIGTDNIDIVINELDALANIDFTTRQLKPELKSLNLIRIGTSGGLQADLAPTTFLASQHAIGFDGLMHHYKMPDGLLNTPMASAFESFSNWPDAFPKAYALNASKELFNNIAADIPSGITITAPGFYAPQGREIRLQCAYPEIFESLPEFTFENQRICNFEMETSALYGLGQALGHNTLSVCLIIANRITKSFANDYKQSLLKMVKLILNRIAQNHEC